MSPHRFGVVGLGNIGAPIAANIANAGFEIIGLDKVGAPDCLPPRSRDRVRYI